MRRLCLIRLIGRRKKRILQKELSNNTRVTLELMMLVLRYIRQAGVIPVIITQHSHRSMNLMCNVSTKLACYYPISYNNMNTKYMASLNFMNIENLRLISELICIECHYDHYSSFLTSSYTYVCKICNGRAGIEPKKFCWVSAEVYVQCVINRLNNQ